jgi:transcriptional regulator with GAF, ATPase, and Fis domain
MLPAAGLQSPSSPELRSLYEMSRLPQLSLHDYFNGAMEILSKYFSIHHSALVLFDAMKDLLHIEGLYGIAKENHPLHYPKGEKGIIVKTLESRQPMVIQHLSHETLYKEMTQGVKPIEKITSPLLCIPLMIDGVSIGVINISPLHGPKDEYQEDFQFLSIFSAMLSQVIKNFQLKQNGLSDPSKKTPQKHSFLDELLDQKLSEVLNKIDPYVESKAKLGVFDDILSLVEKILIKAALERVNHVQLAAAKLLGINRNTLRKKMKEYKIITK